MSAEVPERYEIRDETDHLEVVGLSVSEMTEALRLYGAVQEKRLSARDSLHAIMVDAGVSLIPEATQRQAQRSQALRDELLDKGFETYQTLAERRDSLESSVRAWASRLRDTRRLFTVRHKRHTLIPSIQLTDDGQIDEEIANLVQPLLSAGRTGWDIWAWLTKPTGLISGDIPAEIVRTNPQRAQRAAERSADANLRPDADAS